MVKNPFCENEKHTAKHCPHCVCKKVVFFSDFMEVKKNIKFKNQ